VTYVHAEGYAGGALKHGPFALIEKNTPIILIIPDDCQSSFMEIATAEVKTRGAYTIVITDEYF
jgi:glucosamine--fructose-6-phosphate aminotransferase (isomerizing)